MGHFDYDKSTSCFRLSYIDYTAEGASEVRFGPPHYEHFCCRPDRLNFPSLSSLQYLIIISSPKGKPPLTTVGRPPCTL